MNTKPTNDRPFTANTGTTGQGPGTAARAGGSKDKLKGAFEVIHGIGENIRGTALSTIDSLAHSKGATKNEEIAYQGRLEVEQGLAKLKGSPTRAHDQTSSPSVGSGRATSQSGPATSGARDHQGPLAGAYPQPHGIESGDHGDAGRVQEEDQSGGGGVATSNVGVADSGVAQLGLAEHLHRPAREEEIGACGQGGQSYHSHANYPTGGGDELPATVTHHHRDDAVTDLNAPAGHNDHQVSAFRPSTVSQYDHIGNVDGRGPTVAGGVPGARGGETTNAGLGAVPRRDIHEGASQTGPPPQGYGTDGAYNAPHGDRAPDRAATEMNVPREQHVFGGEQYPTSVQYKPYPQERGGHAEQPQIGERFGDQKRDPTGGPLQYGNPKDEELKGTSTRPPGLGTDWFACRMTGRPGRGGLALLAKLSPKVGR